RVLAKAKIKISHQVHVERLSVSERINLLADRLEVEGSFTFMSCFRFLKEEVTLEEARHEAVVTFLALLEMAKLGVIRVWQKSTQAAEDEDYDPDDDIVIARKDGASPPSEAAGEGGLGAAIEDDYR